MKFSLRPLALLGVVAFLAALGSCAHEAPKPSHLLTRAGFRVFSADDPAKVALLETLPPEKLTPVASHRRIYFVTPDPKTETKIFAGGRQELAAYQRLRAWKKLPPEAVPIPPFADLPDWTGWRGLNDGWYTFSNPVFFRPQTATEPDPATVGEKP